MMRSWIAAKTQSKTPPSTAAKARSNAVFMPWRPKAKVTEHPVASTPPTANRVEYPAYSRMFSAAANPEKPVMFVGKSLADFGFAVEWFRALGASCYVFDQLDDAIGELKKNPLRWSFLFVDIDDLGGPLELVDRLAELRRRLSQVPTILMSGSFARNDFGTERLAVADVSLRLPMSIASLELAAEESVLNCQISTCRFCGRCEKSA